MKKDIDEIDELCYLNKNEVVINESILRQAYRTIEESKSEGLTGVDLLDKLGITKLTLRTIVKKLTKLKLIEYYMKDCGRHSVRT